MRGPTTDGFVQQIKLGTLDNEGVAEILGIVRVQRVALQSQLRESYVELIATLCKLR